MKAKVEIPTGQSYPEMLETAAELTMRTPGFSFCQFDVVRFEREMSCDPAKRNLPALSGPRLFIIGEIMASDN